MIIHHPPLLCDCRLLQETGADQRLFSSRLQFFRTQAVQPFNEGSPSCLIQWFLAEHKLDDVLAVEADEVSGVGWRVDDR